MWGGDVAIILERSFDEVCIPFLVSDGRGWRRLGGVGVAMAESGDHVTLALAGVTFVSRRTLGDVQIVDQAGRDVVDKA